MRMLEDLAEEARTVGLELHCGKSKILSNVEARMGVGAQKEVEEGEQNVEVLP